MCVLLPKIIGYLKNFDDAKTISFLGEDGNTVKYNKIWSKIFTNYREKKLIKHPRKEPSSFICQ